MRDFFHAPTLRDESQYLEGSRIGERSRTEPQLSRRILPVTLRARELINSAASAMSQDQTMNDGSVSTNLHQNPMTL
jgi:hypothetical protein